MGEFSGHTRRLASGDLSQDIQVGQAGPDVVQMMSGLQELQLRCARRWAPCAVAPKA
jgi:hypothetical protein